MCSGARLRCICHVHVLNTLMPRSIFVHACRQQSSRQRLAILRASATQQQRSCCACSGSSRSCERRRHRQRAPRKPRQGSRPPMAAARRCQPGWHRALVATRARLWMTTVTQRCCHQRTRPRQGLRYRMPASGRRSLPACTPQARDARRAQWAQSLLPPQHPRSKRELHSSPRQVPIGATAPQGVRPAASGVGATVYTCTLTRARCGSFLRSGRRVACRARRLASCV